MLAFVIVMTMLTQMVMRHLQLDGEVGQSTEQIHDSKILITQAHQDLIVIAFRFQIIYIYTQQIFLKQDSLLAYVIN